MKLDEAIKILELHNKWRRGDEIVDMQAPYKVGIAIDVVLRAVKRLND